MYPHGREMISYARLCHPANTTVNSLCLFLPRTVANYKPVDRLIEQNGTPSPIEGESFQSSFSVNRRSPSRLFPKYSTRKTISGSPVSDDRARIARPCDSRFPEHFFEITLSECRIQVVVCSNRYLTSLPSLRQGYCQINSVRVRSSSGLRIR